MYILNKYMELFSSSELNDSELEKQIGLPRSTIYNWKQGRNKAYKKYADKISDYFNVSIDYLLSKADDLAPPNIAENNKTIIEDVLTGTLHRILSLLNQNSIEQQEFAQKIGLRKQTITEWKSGKTKSYLKHIDKIADYFLVSTDYLLCKTDDPTPPNKIIIKNNTGELSGFHNNVQEIIILTDKEYKTMKSILKVLRENQD